MKRIGVIVIAAVIAALVAFTASPAWPQANLEAAARAFLAELAAGKFDAAVTHFDETMTRVMPAAKVQEAWQSVEAQAGAFREVTAAKQSEVRGYQLVVLTCRFEKTTLLTRVVFDGQGRIAGLFFAPAEPAPWAAPEYAHTDAFTERTVTVGKAPWELPGTLTIPKGEGKFPAVVLVQGSGAHDGDETIGPNKPFKDLAWGLASRGIAVLRYEKRNHKYGKEMAALKTPTVLDEAVEDAQLAADLLATQPEIDPARIFVLGHSLGGMVAPRIAAGNKHVAGLVVMAGNARPIEDLIVEQLRYLANLDGKVTEQEQKQIDAAEAAAKEIRSPELKPDSTINVLGSKVPGSYFLDLRGYSPPELASKLKLPVLALWGERDYQVRAADFEGWKKALAGRKDATCKSYAELNHLFIAGTGPGTPGEYSKAGHIAPEVVTDIANWILEQKAKH